MIIDQVMKDILTEEQKEIQQNSCARIFFFGLFFTIFIIFDIDEYNSLNLIVTYWILSNSRNFNNFFSCQNPNPNLTQPDYFDVVLL